MQPIQSGRAGGVFKNKKVAERGGPGTDTKSNSICTYTSITNQKSDCVSQPSTQTLDRCSGAHVESVRYTQFKPVNQNDFQTP